MPAESWVPSAIAFDLDGTLADTVADLASAVNAMLAVFGLPPAGRCKVRGWIGHGTEALVQKAMADGLGCDSKLVALDRAIDIFHDHYELANGRETRVFDGVNDTLTRLGDHGCPLACVTNKASRFTLPLLDRLGWRGRFSVVVCGDRPEHRKPQPGSLQLAARRLGMPVSALLMVGDSAIDAAAARNAAVPLALVNYGYGCSEDTGMLQADFSLQCLTDLFELFPSLTQPRGRTN